MAWQPSTRIMQCIGSDAGSFVACRLVSRGERFLRKPAFNTEDTKNHGAARRHSGTLVARELAEQVIEVAIEVHTGSSPGHDRAGHAGISLWGLPWFARVGGTTPRSKTRDSFRPHRSTTAESVRRGTNLRPTRSKQLQPQMHANGVVDNSNAISNYGC